MGFGDLNNVQPSAGRLPYIEPGKYVLEINACKEINGTKGTSFVVEFTVLESDTDRLPVGSECSWVCGMAGGIQLQQQNIKGFLCAAMGEDPGPSTNALLNLATGADNALAGRTIRCFAQLTKTKPKPGFPQGTDFTRMNWSPNAYPPGEGPPTLAALLGATPVGRQGPSQPIPPPPGAPPPPPPPPGPPWAGLPATHVTATHWYNGSAWVAK